MPSRELKAACEAQPPEKAPSGSSSSEELQRNGECRSPPAERQTSAPLRKLKRMFAFESVLFIIACGMLIYAVTTIQVQFTAETASRNRKSKSQYSLHSNHPTAFEDLNENEVLMIKKYITKVLSLTDINKARINDSYLYNVLLEEPWKKQVSGQPHRFAIAIVFHGSFKNPIVKEYRVGPLLKDNRDLLTLNHTRNVPFQKRPLSSPEYKVLKFLVDQTASELKELFQKQYNAAPQTEEKEEGSSVLIHQYTSTVVTDIDESPDDAGRGKARTRNTWFRFNRNIDPFYQYPIDLQVRVLHDGVDSKKWKIDKIWFQGKNFKSTQSLLNYYANGSYKQEKMKQFRSKTLNLKSNEWIDSIPGMLKVDEDMFLVTKHWRLKVAFRSETGIRLFRIFHKNKLVAHELGLAETSTVYEGYTPYMKRMFSIESMFGVGIYTFNLAPGIDCPRDAIFFSAWVVKESLPRYIDRAVCAFAHHSQVDLYSENFSDDDETTTAFTVRSVTTLFNYDYVFDYVFHASGVIEILVTASGNIHFDTIDTENRDHINKGHAILALDGTFTNLYAPIHHHFFHFKADLDIISVKNSWYANIKDPVSLTQTQKQLSTELYEAELSFNEDENVPEYFLTQCKSNNTCCYRTINKAASKNPTIPKMFGFEASISWTKYPLRITKRRRNESRSSIIYNGVDPARPVVKFDDFLDNDPIVNTDLVTWFTMTMLHIPHSEDLPFTNLPGGALRTYLIPTNFINCHT